MIKKEWFDTPKPTLWQQVRLWFKPTMLSIDIVNDESVVVFYKYIDGKIIILEHKPVS